MTTRPGTTAIRSGTATARRRCLRWIAPALAGLLLVVPTGGAADDLPPVNPSRAAAIPAYRQANTVAVLTVEGVIDHMTLRSLERRIANATRDGADAIVLDINTPGGRVDVTLDICNLLKDRSATPANVVAWIHPQAYSAGTIISLACREIVVAPNATFGDAAPIQGMPVIGLVQMAPAERAKVEAPILAEVIDSARRNHYDENLVQAFVSVGVELWLLEHVQSGERIFVDRTEYVAVFGEEPTQGLTSVTPPAHAGAAVAPRFQSPLTPAEDAPSPGLSEEEIREEIERAQSLPRSRASLTDTDRDLWNPVLQVVSNDRLLTVKRSEALAYGLAADTIADDTELMAFFGATNVRRYDASWSEGLVRFLTNPIVRGVLIVIFLIGLFIELAAPGLGVFGAVAAAALLMLIGAPLLAGMAQWWDVLLIVIGMMLLAVEVLVIPGLGVAGLAGAACLLVGLVGTFVSGDVRSGQGQEELATGMISVLTAMFAAGVGIWLISRQLDSFPLMNRLVLRAEVGGDPRRGAAILEAVAPASSRGPAIGDTGVAATDLRPAGRGEFGGRMVDVQSPGRYIERGAAIRVVSVNRFVIEVEEPAP